MTWFVVLAQRIISFGEKICHQIGVKDIRSTCLLTAPTTEPSVFIGRVVCDSEGRLNAHSCLLEGVWSYEADVLKARLIRVILDLSKSLDQLSICLFPGQVREREGEGEGEERGRGRGGERGGGEGGEGERERERERRRYSSVSGFSRQ